MKGHVRKGFIEVTVWMLWFLYKDVHGILNFGNCWPGVFGWIYFEMETFLSSI